MRGGDEAPWRACTDRRLVHGLMRELLLWETPLALESPAGTVNGVIVAIDEPEDATAPADRWLRVRTDRSLPDGALTVSAVADLGALRWTAAAEPDGRDLRIRMPDAVAVDTSRAVAAAPAGRQVAAVFCQSGAITGPFIRAQRPAIHAFADRWSDPWPPALLSRWVETDQAGRIIGQVCAARMGDSLYMITDIARSRPPGGSSGRRFIGGAILALAARIRAADPDASVLISWGPGHPLWSPFEDYLAQAGARRRIAEVSTLYTRFADPSDQAPPGIALTPLTAAVATSHLRGLAGAHTRRVAAALGVGGPRGTSSLAQALAEAGATHDQAVVQVERGAIPVAIALFTGLPPSWNLRKTCNCVWLFPLEAWRPADRPAVYAALRDCPWAGAAPGVLEVTAIAGDPGPGKWLDWKMLDCDALAFFEAWAA